MDQVYLMRLYLRPCRALKSQRMGIRTILFLVIGLPTKLAGNGRQRRVIAVNKIIPTTGKWRIDPAVEEQPYGVDHRMSFTSCGMLTGGFSRSYVFLV
jgi:hypothetical protein